MDAVKWGLSELRLDPGSHLGQNFQDSLKQVNVIVLLCITCDDDTVSPCGDIKSLAQQDYFNSGPSLSFLRAS